MAEIKSFEELEKVLGELMLEKGTGLFHEEINYYNVLGLINSLKASVKKNKRLLPFDTENRPSIVDKCGRCGHDFGHHNLSCYVGECTCQEFIIEVIELRRLLEGKGEEIMKLISEWCSSCKNDGKPYCPDCSSVVVSISLKVKQPPRWEPKKLGRDEEKE